MNPISASTIESRNAQISNLSEEALEELIDQASEQQPFMLAYLMAAGETEFNPAEQELLLYTGIMVWQIMRKEDQKLGSVTEEALETAEETNRLLIEYLEGEAEVDLFETVETVIGSYNQGDLFRFIIETIMDEEEGGYSDEEPIRSPMKGMLIFYLKILVDCLDG